MDEKVEILKNLIACVTGDEKGEFLPLDDSYENLQNFYREEVTKKLKEIEVNKDLSNSIFNPNETFFICDEKNMHPFSKDDISVLLKTKMNPYTDKKFSEEGLRNLQKIKEYFGGKFANWGGLLELLETLDENALLGRGDSSIDLEILKEKIIAIESSKTEKELCEIIQTFGSPKDGELAYLNSPVLDGLYMWCTEKDTNNFTALQMLKERGVDFSLDDVVDNNRINALRILFENTEIDPMELDIYLENAAHLGRTEIVKLLLKNGAKDFTFALRNASKYGHIEIVKLLLESQHYTGDDESNALYWASKKGHTEIVKLLQSTLKRTDYGSTFGWDSDSEASDPGYFSET